MPTRRIRRTLIALVLLGVPAGAADAGADDRHARHDAVIIQFDNDYFAGEDRNYTHGTRVVWSTTNAAPRHWSRRVARWLGRFGLEGEVTATRALGQSIFTPDDISQTTLIVDDQPYAGYLYVAAGIEVERRGPRRRLDNVEVQIGLVGPDAKAEQVQRRWHETFGFDEPRGWDNQLDNEPALLLQWDRTWGGIVSSPLAASGRWSQFGVDVSPHVGAAVGNVYTYGSTGVTLRFGEDLPDDYGPPFIRPSVPGSDSFTPQSGLDWYLFAGVELRAVVRNIFLDGNTFTDSHSVDKKLAVGEVQVGVVLTLRSYRLTYTQVLRSSEFAGESSSQYGAISFGVTF